MEHRPGSVDGELLKLGLVIENLGQAFPSARAASAIPRPKSLDLSTASLKLKARCAPSHAGATAQSSARRRQLRAIRRSAKDDSPLTEEQYKRVRSA